MTPKEREEYFAARKKQAEKQQIEYSFFYNEDNLLKYRGEQTVLMKVNNIPVSNINTKTDYTIQGLIDDGQLVVSVQVDENIANAFPPASQGALGLMDDIETVYSNIKAVVNPMNGRIHNIRNHKKILSDWEDYKYTLLDKYAFLREENAKKALKVFINNIEDYLLVESKFVRQLYSKMFFFVFFDKYLVSQEKYLPFEQNYYSYLFDNKQQTLNIKQQITGEEPEVVKVNRLGSLAFKSGEQSEIEKIYNEKYKPTIGYSFSEYNISYAMDYLLNTKINCLENASLAITEEINNNIELTITYKLRKIK